MKSLTTSALIFSAMLSQPTLAAENCEPGHQCDLHSHTKTEFVIKQVFSKTPYVTGFGFAWTTTNQGQTTQHVRWHFCKQQRPNQSPYTCEKGFDKERRRYFELDPAQNLNTEAAWLAAKVGNVTNECSLEGTRSTSPSFDWADLALNDSPTDFENQGDYGLSFIGKPGGGARADVGLVLVFGGPNDFSETYLLPKGFAMMDAETTMMTPSFYRSVGKAAAADLANVDGLKNTEEFQLTTRALLAGLATSTLLPVTYKFKPDSARSSAAICKATFEL